MEERGFQYGDICSLKHLSQIALYRYKRRRRGGELSFFQTFSPMPRAARPHLHDVGRAVEGGGHNTIKVVPHGRTA